MVANIMPISGSDARAAARLCNFPTGHAGLLPDHITWLDTTVAPLVKAVPDSWVNIIGYASHLRFAGDHAHSHVLNERLSFDRCESVRKRVTTYGAPVQFPKEWGKGDSESTGGIDNNDGYWRAVDVYVYGNLPAPPPPPRPPAPPPSVPSSTKFRIRVFRASGASILIVQGDAVVFQIVDDANVQCGVYYYIGAGVAVSIKGITTPPGSIAGAGAFTPFVASRPIRLASFEGEANFFQSPGVSVGSHSLGGQAYIAPESSRLRAMPGVRMTVLSPQVIPVATGSGFGAGLGSVSTGKLSAPIIFKVGECCGAPGGICTLFK